MTANDLDATELSATLGSAIRARRKSLDMRLLDVAEAAQLSQAFLSQIENGAPASMFTHHRIAVALDTTLHALLEVAASPPVTLVRRDEGESFPLFEGATVRVLVGGDGHAFEANENVAAAGAEMDEPFVHPGEDFVIVIEGVVEYEIGGENSVLLRAGDVLSYPAERPHLYRVVGDGQARLIVVNAPGSLITGRE